MSIDNPQKRASSDDKNKRKLALDYSQIRILK